MNFCLYCTGKLKDLTWRRSILCCSEAAIDATQNDRHRLRNLLRRPLLVRLTEGYSALIGTDAE